MLLRAALNTGSLQTVDFNRPTVQNGLEETTYGSRPFIPTQRTQASGPPAGIEDVALPNPTSSAIVVDIPTKGLLADNWKPIWDDQVVLDNQRKQFREWNVMSVSSARDDSFRHNQGSIYKNKGWVEILPTAYPNPPAYHPLKLGALIH